MREFFTGWRQKVGCGAILIVLWVMMAWIRSLYVHDSLSTYTNYSYYTISSRVGCLFVAIDELEFVGTGHLLGRWHGWYSRPLRASEWADNPGECGLLIDMDSTSRKFGLFGFEANFFQTDSTDYKRKLRGLLLCVPYWGIALSLALVPAYVFLWKPQTWKLSDRSATPDTDRPATGWISRSR